MAANPYYVDRPPAVGQGAYSGFLVRDCVKASTAAVVVLVLALHVVSPQYRGWSKHPSPFFLHPLVNSAKIIFSRPPPSLRSKISRCLASHSKPSLALNVE